MRIVLMMMGALYAGIGAATEPEDFLAAYTEQAKQTSPDRFTREGNVEAWFGWNCKMLLKRECTPVEKSDLITWLLTIE